MSRSLPLLAVLLGLVAAQTPGATPEVHPTLQTWECTKAGGCVSKTSQLVMDALAHPIHQKDNPALGCTDGTAVNKTVCPDEATCAQNCIVEGISDYSKHGVTTNGSSLLLKQLLDGQTVSPRVYLLDEAGDKYEMLQLTGREFSFVVDGSKLPCGMNGALYLSEMEASGGKSENNTAGAAYGSGYCDAQCYTQPFANGVANLKNQGLCCNEMDIWEANKEATSIAPHVCNQTSFYGCTGAECSFDGVCDQWGCSYNPYRFEKDYYGPGLKVDTSKPFTVVTQFPADVNGTLTAIRRLYVQGGKIISNAALTENGAVVTDEINNEYCSRPGGGTFMPLGGVAGMGNALSRGMVLIFSVWWDVGGFMTWLDGGDSGPCNATEGNPTVITQVEADPSVVFSQVKWGEIDSTYTTS